MNCPLVKGSPIRAGGQQKKHRPSRFVFVLLRVASDHRFEVTDPILAFRRLDFESSRVRDSFSHPSGSSAVSPQAFFLKASPSGPQSRARGIQKTFSAGPRSFSFSRYGSQAIQPCAQPVFDSRHGRITFKAAAKVSENHRLQSVLRALGPTPFSGWRRLSQIHLLWLCASSGNIRFGS